MQNCEIHCRILRETEKVIDIAKSARRKIGALTPSCFGIKMNARDTWTEHVTPPASCDCHFKFC